jgi:hypothetical protein
MFQINMAVYNYYHWENSRNWFYREPTLVNNDLTNTASYWDLEVLYNGSRPLRILLDFQLCGLLTPRFVISVLKTTIFQYSTAFESKHKSGRKGPSRRTNKSIFVPQYSIAVEYDPVDNLWHPVSINYNEQQTRKYNDDKCNIQTSSNYNLLPQLNSLETIDISSHIGLDAKLLPITLYEAGELNWAEALAAYNLIQDI